MKWHEAVEKVTPYVVKIETPRGHGTGFLYLYNESTTFCGIATAYHVVQHADKWQEPIRVTHADSDEPRLLKEDERVIFGDPDNDSAVIFFSPRELDLPKKLLPLIPSDQVLRVGAEVGWLGYPSVSPNRLCFFSGNISSARIDQNSVETYFIDGVAINGVSGGPVFSLPSKGKPEIVGAISAYYPNVVTGTTTLPGLAFAQGVSSFHDTIRTVKTLDEARVKQKEQEQEQDQGESDLIPAEPSTPGGDEESAQ